MDGVAWRLARDVVIEVRLLGGKYGEGLDDEAPKMGLEYNLDDDDDMGSLIACSSW